MLYSSGYFKILNMTDTRITRPRRIFVEYIGTVGKATFTDLKANLVGKWEGKMDLTTLYRMIEIFKSQGLIHEVKHQNERIVFLVTDDFNPNRDSVEDLWATSTEFHGALYRKSPQILWQMCYSLIPFWRDFLMEKYNSAKRFFCKILRIFGFEI